MFSDDKTNGLIVDYVGVFDDVAKALEFDDERMKKVIENIAEIKSMLPALVKDALAFFRCFYVGFRHESPLSTHEAYKLKKRSFLHTSRTSEFFTTM